MRSLIVVSILFVSSRLFGQGFGTASEPKDEKPITWASQADKTAGLKKCEEITLVFTAKIFDLWYLYSTDFDKELGPMVTEFFFDKNDSYELIGPIKAVGAKKKFDAEVWQGEYTYFTKTARFEQKIRIKKANPKISVRVRYQVCSDSLHICKNYEETFSFNNLQVVAGEELCKQADEGNSSSPNPARCEYKPKEVRDSTGYTGKALSYEKQKAQLSRTDCEGRDESREILKNFRNKYYRKP